MVQWPRNKNIRSRASSSYLIWWFSFNMHSTSACCIPRNRYLKPTTLTKLLSKLKVPVHFYFICMKGYIKVLNGPIKVPQGSVTATQTHLEILYEKIYLHDLLSCAAWQSSNHTSGNVQCWLNKGENAYLMSVDKIENYSAYIMYNWKQSYEKMLIVIFSQRIILNYYIWLFLKAFQLCCSERDILLWNNKQNMYYSFTLNFFSVHSDRNYDFNRKCIFKAMLWVF